MRGEHEGRYLHREAHTYRLPALKKTCVRLLVDFEVFTTTWDQELVDEIKQIITASRGRKLPATRKSAVRKPKSDSPGLLRRSTRLKLQND
jgi:hypothetical protein